MNSVLNGWLMMLAEHQINDVRRCAKDRTRAAQAAPARALGRKQIERLSPEDQTALARMKETELWA
ncbi:hypothetical protein [Rhizobium mesoamericanum]|uniref:hypothetical protein n=1 Tax=Rhizobium mesoamericanum TaxID=1079800 RepID=UPI0005924F98|nr:hypothetical protein [Rhizobium mesoamericanum]